MVDDRCASDANDENLYEHFAMAQDQRRDLPESAHAALGANGWTVGEENQWEYTIQFVPKAQIDVDEKKLQEGADKYV